MKVKLYLTDPTETLTIALDPKCTFEQLGHLLALFAPQKIKITNWREA